MNIEKMREEIPNMSTEDFKTFRSTLNREELQALRPEIEARRGITRDEQGRIIRSKEWKKERIGHLEMRIGDYEQRIKNAKVEIKNLQKELSPK